MPFQIISGDITTLKVDAIVNAANATLLGGGGVDAAIHHAAGPQLLAECRTLGGCQTGQAKITGGYKLPAKHVIHTVGPIWQGGDHGEEGLLADCYRHALEIAQSHKLESIAFPLISAGVYGYPKAEAIAVASNAIRDFLAQAEGDMSVYLVIYDAKGFEIDPKVNAAVQAYLETHLELTAKKTSKSPNKKQRDHHLKASDQEQDLFVGEALSSAATYMEKSKKVSGRRLEDLMDQLEATFSERLLQLIDERNMDDVSVYKRANIDRKLFSKIRGDRNYQPSKHTVMAFAIALKLDLDSTQNLLASAGFALSRSSKADMIFTYFIENGIYDIFELNTVLFKFEQPPLGARGLLQGNPLDVEMSPAR